MAPYTSIMIKPRHPGTLRKNSGFSLIEILVSLVVLSIGLLGTAGLQLATLRSNQFTAQAATAAQLARDYEEIVQMLPSSSVSSSEGTSTFSVLDTSVSGTSTVTSCMGTAATCTKDQLTSFMINDWKAKIMRELPGGRAKVCRDSTPKDTSGTGIGLYHWDCDGVGDMIMIKLGWAAKADKNDKTMLAISADNRPRIVITVFGNQQDFAD